MYAYVLVNGDILEVWFSLERAVARHLALPGSTITKTILEREVSPAEFRDLQGRLARHLEEVTLEVRPVA